VAASGEHLTVWDIHSHDVVKVLTQDGQMDHPSFSRDGKSLYTRTYAGLIQEWDLAGDRRFLATLAGDPLSWSEPGPRVSPDGRKIGYVALGPEFRVRDVATGKLGPVVQGGMTQGRYLDIAWRSDSRTVNITSGDPLVRTWDSANGELIAERRLAPAPSTEAAAFAFFTVDGKYLLVGTTQGRLHVLDARTLLPARAPIQVYEKKPNDQQIKEVFVFSPSGDGHTVYLPDRIVDYVAGTVRPMPDLGFSVSAVFASPDGKRLLVDTGATGVGLLDTATLHWTSRPNAAQAGLVGWYSQFSEDGSQFASVNENQLSHWDGRTGAYLGTVAVDFDGAPAFAKNNKQLIFASINGTVLTWDLDPRTWIAAACRLAGRGLTQQEWRNYLPNRPFVRVCA
jgi:WD40 repeat protein